MSLSDKVITTSDGTALGGANLTSFSTNDLEQFTQFSQEIQFTTTDMETEETEAVTNETKDDSMQDEEEKGVMEPEIGAQEIEIETERTESPEEILPDLKTKMTVVPPLRPLTIAPKPTLTPKVPLSLKSTTVSGQQLFLVQGGTPGQAIKFLSPQGQSISLANISKSIALRPAVKATAVGAAQSTGISVVQPKQIVMRKMVNTTQTQKATSIVETKPTGILVAQKTEGGQTLKLTPSQSSNVLISSPTKTITLAQAQQMGLLSGTKIVSQPITKQTLVVNKGQSKPIRIMPQASKSPAKILPAPQVNPTGKGSQRIILKQTGSGTTIVPNQIIQVAGAQGLPTGQLHQINIPGKGIQYIKFVTASTNTDTSLTSSPGTIATAKLSPQTVTTGSKLIAITTTNTNNKVAGVLTEVKNIGATTNIVPKATTKVVASTGVRSAEMTSIAAPTQLLMLPAGYIRAPPAKVPIPAKPAPTKPAPPPVENTTSTPTDSNSLESNGMRPRKPCNCTKSQCLKLYCDCFANGEFCYMCNCMNCFNNLENEEHRQRAIKSCLERNPNAFRPKIGKAKDVGTDTQIRKHTKGCNCKRSGCLKNYCECYEAKIACSSNCKCFGCRNIENSIEKKNIQPQVNPAIPIHSIPPNTPKIHPTRSLLQIRPRRHSNSKHAFSLITDDVIELTTQCLLTISDKAEADAQNEESTKELIIQEFGRCLQEIISHSASRHVTNSAGV